mmetsp:Transcript_59907/g.107615  ORF Transcript_59907/g.107615 Transcript_59907/m.107615 type:complete len:204 (+) Transcript_59907:1566-2177(+)
MLLICREGSRIHYGAQSGQQATSLVFDLLLQQGGPTQLLREGLDGTSQHVGGFLQLALGGQVLSLLLGTHLLSCLQIGLVFGHCRRQLLQFGGGHVDVRGSLSDGRGQLLDGFLTILDVIAQVTLAARTELGVILVGFRGSHAILLDFVLQICKHGEDFLHWAHGADAQSKEEDHAALHFGRVPQGIPHKTQGRFVRRRGTPA